MKNNRKIHTGAKGGCFYFSPSGKKVYLKEKVTNAVASQTNTNKLLVNHVAIVVDESGSMSGLRKEAVEAVNRQLQTIRSEAARLNQRTFVSIEFFNTTSRTFVKNASIEGVRDLRYQDYYPSGGTALIDATGNAIDDLSQRGVAVNDDVSYLIIVVTDGEENSSRIYTNQRIASMIREKQGTDYWSFVFNVPRGHTTYIQSFFGVPVGNIQEWDQTAAGIQTYSTNVSVGTQSFYANRARGIKATKNFFTTDMSQVAKRDIAQLPNVNADFRKLKVLKEVDIRPFVESQGFTFAKGNGFYELTKPEDIQDYKQMVIMEKSSGKLYGGAHARDIIGIPSSGTTRVKPGNHMNYSIFVQSTSVNRKLVRGTTLLYRI